MNVGTPKDKNLNINQNININNKTPSQKSVDDKEKSDKNLPQSISNKKTSLPNFVERSEINEKNFPQKINYFNEKKNSIKSPIIDYFSPSFYFQKYHSPEEIMHQNSDLLYSGNNNINRSVEQNFKKSPNIIEQNFNFSPSNIFNQNNNNNMYLNSSSNNSLNNYKIQKENSIEEEENKTLQERIGILLGKNESNKNNNILINTNNNIINNNINNQIQNLNLVNNNFININNNNTNNLNNNQNINNNNNMNNIPQNEEENENQEEVYILNLNSEDENEKDYEDEIQNNNNSENDIQNNKINNNKNIEKNNYQNKINIKEQLNNIINTNENEFPSYGGGAIYNNNNINNINNTNINTNQNQQNMPILNNINNTMNNIYYTPMNNNIIYPPLNYGYFPYGYFNNQNLNNNINNNYYPQKIGQFMNMPFVPNNQSNNNKFTNIKNEKNTKPFYYNGDQYQINNNRNKNNNSNNNKKKENKFNNINNNNSNINVNQNDKNIYTIGSKDLVVTITSNKKKIKRVNPKAYLNESYEYLSHNIFILSKDQAGCRFLQEKIDEDPINATNYFYEAIQPYLTSLMKDPFGNYLVQKIIKNLDEKKIKKILEIISTSIVEIGTNSHGTRVIQFLIGFLTTKELQDYFIEIIKPYTIHLLKELNGAHIIQKVLLNYPNSCEEINKIIIDNCSFLATHRHGCCVLQKFIDGNYKNLEKDLIKNLVNNTLMLITDQFGNYVIQSILLLKNDEINSQIAKKINDNIPYYSKHRYSSNVVEKCFDLCNENDKNNFVEKLCSNEIVTELILDDHGNYVIQKVLQCANDKIKEKILKVIFILIPKIKEVPFGERLLNRLLGSYPQLNGNNFNANGGGNKKKNNFENKNEQEKNYKNRKNKK